MFRFLFLILFVSSCGSEPTLKTYTVPKEERPNYTVPMSWNELEADGMREAYFQVRGVDGEEVDVTVVTLDGEAGSDLSNINRWRNEIGLPDWSIDEMEIMKMPTSKGEATAVDLIGSSERILAAYIRSDDSVCFFKMKGDVALIEREKEHFFTFFNSYRK